MSTTHLLPFVSVIVPVYNGAEHIRTCIESLLAQDYPKDRLEIIIVDNNSSDDTKSIIQAYPVIFLEESKRSSYAARNAGIARSKGEVLAFTDADCRAHADWLSSGVQCIAHGTADFVGGAVHFFFSPKHTAAEEWDALSNIDNRTTVEEKGTAATANIFAPRRMFDAVGLFSIVQSGGDFEWTARARAKGFKIGFCETAIVEHPARTLHPLMEKSYRVGTGAIASWRARGKSWLWVTAAACSCALPVMWFKMPKILKRKHWRGPFSMLIKIAFVAYVTKLATLAGILASLRRK